MKLSTIYVLMPSILFLSLPLHSAQGSNYLQIICNESFHPSKKRVVILEQLDTSVEDGKDLMNIGKAYVSGEVPFSLTIYNNATIGKDGKSLEESVRELKNRNQEPDYIGSLSKAVKKLTFTYNRLEVRMAMKLDNTKEVVLSLSPDSMSLSCELRTFQRPTANVQDSGVQGEVCDLSKGDKDCVEISTE